MLFYSVLAFIFAVVIIAYAILNIKNNKKLTTIIFIISALILIVLGTLSFIVDPKYEWILILGLIIDLGIEFLIFYIEKK